MRTALKSPKTDLKYNYISSTELAVHMMKVLGKECQFCGRKPHTLIIMEINARLFHYLPCD